jgi:pimeloyl-ACP methyl ester carboxylesterase
MIRPMADIVLLHGTTSSQAAFERLSHALRARGWTAHGIDLPSDPGLRAADYARLVADALAGAVRQPVVLGHSGAGVLVPAVSRALDARHMVWLAGYVPMPGVSLAQEAQEQQAAIVNPEWAGVDPTEDDAAAAYFLFHDCDWATVKGALAFRRRWYPEAAYAERFPEDGFPDVPGSVIVASHDRTLRPQWCRPVARERLGVEPVEIDTGHYPRVSRPGELAVLLLDTVLELE